MNKITRFFHLSANQYPRLPIKHHSKVIWDELSKDCDEYHIFARSTDMSFSNTVEGKLHLHLVPCLGRGQFTFVLLSWLIPFYFVKYKPTHVIAQCPVLGGVVAAIFKRVFNYKLFVEVHGEHYFLPIKKGGVGKLHHAFFKLLTRFTFNKCDAIRSLSSDMSNYIESKYGHEIKPKIIIIPNRVNLDVFSYFKTDYLISEPVKIITVGRFSKIKNHLSLIKDLYLSGVRFHLTIVGSGPLNKYYIPLVRELGKESDLTILENIPHVELCKILPTNDIYIHYSLSEGVPRATLEAMACGLPIISTNVGYISDLLVSGDNSLVINKPYQSNLAEQLKLLISSTDFREKIGMNARSSIKQNYEWNFVFELYRNGIMHCEA